MGSSIGGGIANIVAGLGEVDLSEKEAAAADAANHNQLRRERRQADNAIDTALQKGEFEAGRQRLYGAMLQAKQRNAYYASGVDATKGTAAAVQADSAALADRDAQQTAIDAAREVWGYKESKRQSQEEYEARKAGIANKRQAGQLGGYTKFIGGASQVGAGVAGKFG